LRKGPAFTLAEVLITLGIIGVIAALSVPNLFVVIQKRSAETKLKRFYAEINQAVKLSASQTGIDVDGWVIRNKEYKKADLEQFIDTYLRPTLNISYTKSVAKNPNACGGKCDRILIVLNNGIAFSMYIDGNGGDVFMHPDPTKTDYKDPRQSFAFQMAKKTEMNGGNFISVDSVEPYTMNWKATEGINKLKNDGKRGCNRKSGSNNQYCTKWIQLNEWKIPKDYPW
jgi:prepilin-type N-terminal cleavage/methylation domain-containing protein